MKNKKNNNKVSEMMFPLLVTSRCLIASNKNKKQKLAHLYTNVAISVVFK